MITVFLPTQLDDYTGGNREVLLQLSVKNPNTRLTLHDVVDALDEQFKGLAFRIVDEQKKIRRHIAFFVGDSMVRELDVPLTGNERIQIVGALSGG